MFAGKTWLKTVASAQKAAQEKNQLILVDMFAEWCGWCHRFEREVFPSAVFQDATKDIILLRLDTEDRAEGSKFAQKYSVTSLPTFLLLAPDLTLAGILRGYAPANDFVRSLDTTRKAYDEFVKRSNNEAAIAKDPVKRLELAKEYTQRGAYDKAESRLKKIATEKGMPVALRDDAYYHLALTYVIQNKLDEALKTIRALNSVSKIGDSVERSLLLAGQIYMQQGNLLGAATEFRRFKKTYPNSPLIPNIDAVLPGIERQLQAAGK